jgi:ubiquinone/menaquinone biosynthesis C-methylase UbiE
MNLPVEQHYSRDQLLENILVQLKKTGIDTDKLTRKDLAPIDEFHVRGAEVTIELARQSRLEKDMCVLDIGCGIGGPSRLLAEEYGCRVTGIDITQEYIRIAKKLSKLTGLADRTEFIHASALQLPFATGSFDSVWTQHVQMNIGDKKQFYAEISRVLKPGAQFVYYDIFSIGHQPIAYPVPWAGNASISHLATTDEFRKYLADSGLEPVQMTDQTRSGINFLNRLLERVKTQSVPPLSLQLLIGDDFEQKFRNLYQNFIDKKLKLESGVCQRE